MVGNVQEWTSGTRDGGWSYNLRGSYVERYDLTKEGYGEVSISTVYYSTGQRPISQYILGGIRLVKEL